LHNNRLGHATDRDTPMTAPASALTELTGTAIKVG
jgi:hypothetical protein